jgi:hypothetical protein
MPFGIMLATEVVNQFLLDRTDNKLQHWTAQKLNNTGQSVICNGILMSATMYFLAIWGGTQSGISKLKAKIRNYLWMAEDRPCWARIAWHVCSLKKKDGGLGLVDPAEAMVAMMSKWVLSALEPWDSNLKLLLWNRLSLYQPYWGGIGSRTFTGSPSPTMPREPDQKCGNRQHTRGSS